jgi:hypothetical protein
LDIRNLYSNILVIETRTILTDILKYELVAPQTQQEILKWYDVITSQNYFTHKKDTVIQHDGLAMGTPSSELIAEIFLQHIQHTHLTHLTHKHKIINYCRHVDDILLIFDSNHTNIQKILNDFNTLHPKLQFTAEAERDHTLNYFNISIHRTPTNIKTAVYRKPTFTDTIIPYTSNHPTHHKYAAVRFLYNRLNSYNLQQKEYRHELNIIHNILHNNAFPIKPHPPTHNTTKPTALRTNKQKWTTFTYVGEETSYITNVFRKTELKIAFHTTNTIGNLLSHKNPTPNKFSLSGVYKLTCPDCNKAYVGETGRRFTTRFKEHEKAFWNNSHTSSFAKHLNEEAHFLGPTKSIMQVLHYHKKGTHLNTLERFHIHIEVAENNHLNKNHTIFPNAISDTLTKTHRP